MTLGVLKQERRGLVTRLNRAFDGARGDEFGGATMERVDHGLGYVEGRSAVFELSGEGVEFVLQRRDISPLEAVSPVTGIKEKMFCSVTGE